MTYNAPFCPVTSPRLGVFCQASKSIVALLFINSVMAFRAYWDYLQSVFFSIAEKMMVFTSRPFFANFADKRTGRWYLTAHHGFVDSIARLVFIKIFKTTIFSFSYKHLGVFFIIFSPFILPVLFSFFGFSELSLALQKFITMFLIASLFRIADFISISIVISFRALQDFFGVPFGINTTSFFMHSPTFLSLGIFPLIIQEFLSISLVAILVVFFPALIAPNCRATLTKFINRFYLSAFTTSLFHSILQNKKPAELWDWHNSEGLGLILTQFCLPVPNRINYCDYITNGGAQ